MLQQRYMVRFLETFAWERLQTAIDFGFGAIAKAAAHANFETFLKLVKVNVLEDFLIVQLIKDGAAYLRRRKKL